MPPSLPALLSRPVSRTLFSLLVFGCGATFFFGAPYLMPLPFPSAGFETSQRLSTLGVSPYNRDLQYVVSVAGAAMIFVGLWTAPWRIVAARDYWVAALGSVLLLAVGLAVYGPSAGGAVQPFHEGEWLAPALGSPYPLIHGYAVNYLPARVASALFGEDYVVGGARVLRLLLALLAYALVPFAYYQIARYSVGRGWANALALGSAVAVFVVFHGTLFSLGTPQHGILHAPVRNVPFIALLIVAIWLVVPYREEPANADRHLVPRSACFGAVAAAGMLVNILNVVFFAMLVLLVGAYLAVRGGERVRTRLARFALASLAAFAAVAALSEFAMPGSMIDSFRSFAHFLSIGRVTFSDQLRWFYAADTTDYHATGTLMSFVSLGVGAVWLLDRARHEGLRAAAATVFPYVVCLAAIAFCLFANTGPVTTTFGLALLLPIALGCFASTTLAHSTWLPPILASTAGSRNAKFIIVTASMTTLMLALAGSGSQALESLDTLLRTSVRFNGTFFPFYRLSAVRQRLDESGSRCTVSLPSDGLLLFGLGRPSCLSVRLPIYDASRAGQARMIEDLKGAEPALVHVASFTMDHQYPPYLHVPALTHFVLSHYRPDTIVEGRWFWSLAQAPLHKAEQAVETELPRIPLARDRELDYDLRLPLPPGVSATEPWVGLIVYIRGQSAPSAALVGQPTGGRVYARLSVTSELALHGGDIWLVRPGNALTKMADIYPR